MSILDSNGVEIKTYTTNRSVNFSMFDIGAERIFKQSVDDIIKDLALTVKKEIESDLGMSEYNLKQEAKLKLFPDEKFKLELGSINEEITSNDFEEFIEPPIELENLAVAIEEPSVISRIFNKVTSIFRG